MQILILINKFTNLQQLESIFNYHKSLQQNILFVEYTSLYFKQKMIYSRQCLIANTNETKKNVLLSPSLIIDLSGTIDNIRLAKYLKTFWMNAQQVFYQKEISAELTPPLAYLNNLTNISHCISYTDNNSQTSFKVIQDSIHINTTQHKKFITNHCMGTLEQTITEYFADKNFFSQFEWPRDEIVSNHQSMIFSIQFTFEKRNADYIFSISVIKSLNIYELLQHNQQFVFEYFDHILNYRYQRYINLVKFRQYISGLCQEQNIDLEPSYFRTFVLTRDNTIGLQRGYFAGVNNPNMIEIVKDKHKTNVFLHERGFKVNLSCEYSLKELNNKKVIENTTLNYPLVLKPTDKKEGYGVVTNIQTPERMLYSVDKLVKMGDIEPVLIEEFFTGITYRVLVVGVKVIAVLKFIPASIKGDGKTSIENLIRSKNLVSRSRIRINNALKLSIFNDGYNWETILPKGKNYILSHNSHASMGGQATNVTDVFREKYKIIAIKVAEDLELKHTGIDMIVNADGDYRILEVNCAPALSTHLKPKYGTSIDTYSKVLDCLCEHTDLNRPDNSFLPELVEYHQ